MGEGIRLEVRRDQVDLVAPEFTLRFKSLRAFRRFREWIEAARIVGEEEGRPVQSELSPDGGDEWYVVMAPGGGVVLHRFSDEEVEVAVTMPAERWRELGHAVLGTSGEV
jgi:hypothetical protein